MPLPVLERGRGAPLVFLHGWTLSGEVFADQAARLAPGFHCLAPDLPGHGRAAGRAPGIGRSADALAALLESRDLAGVTLVGWSMGATVAWDYLARHGSARVARMVSVDMSPRIEAAPGWPHGMLRPRPGPLAPLADRFAADWPAAARAIAAGMFAGPAGAPCLSVAAAEARIAANAPGTMAQSWRALCAADLRAAVAALPVPLLVLRGGRSRVYGPGVTDWLLRSAPRARATEFPEAGHAPHLEDPERFARILAGFAAGEPGA